MTDEPTLGAPLPRRTLLSLILLVILAAGSAATSFGNLFVQDDLAIILKDEGIHAFSLSRIFLEPYWPAPFIRDLYRPLASTLMAIEWQMGGGSPLTYRIISVTLYAMGALACFGLARRLLPRPIAWGIAALFAVHPVHVESVAVAVNQGELIVGLMLVLMTTWYIERRMRGPLGWRDHLLVGVATLVGGLFKEHAVVLPGLLILVELVLFREPPTIIGQLRALRPSLLYGTAAVLLLLWPRAILFKGDLKGSFTAEGLLGLTMYERALTMLQVVPRWIYLIIWPQHLQADYSPHVILPARAIGVEQLAGLLLIGLVVWVAVRTIKEFPAIFVGVGFAAITLIPVSNVLAATGIMMAERTLYTPSFGALIAIGGVVQAIGQRLPARPIVRQVAWGALEVLLALGLIRSILRYEDWHDPMALATKTVEDAPLSYRSWFGLGTMYLELGRLDEGRRMLRRAIEFSPGSTQVYYTLADSYRASGDCARAIPVYEQGLAKKAYDLPRAGLIACRVWLGDYARARNDALIGMRDGEDGRLFRTWLRLADSAIRINAPPGTIRFQKDSTAQTATPP